RVAVRGVVGAGDERRARRRAGARRGAADAGHGVRDRHGRAAHRGRRRGAAAPRRRLAARAAARPRARAPRRRGRRPGPGPVVAGAARPGRRRGRRPYGTAVTVVVIGAGIAGAACAAELAAAGVPVRLVDRAGEVGGRMGGQRVAGRPVDLGAAYFTVRDGAFERVVRRWRDAGLVRPWTSELAGFGRGTRDRAPGPQRWAAPGGLGGLVAELVRGLDVELGREVRRVGPGPVVDGEPADAVVLAMPDPEALRLLGPEHPAAAPLVGRGWRPAI